MRTATLPPYTLCPRLEPRGSASAMHGKAVVSISWAAGYGTRFFGEERSQSAGREDADRRHAA